MTNPDRIDVDALPPALKARVLRVFATAYAVDRSGAYVYCMGLHIGDRLGGTAALRISPAGVMLADDIAAHAPTIA